jgi:hypothetical protein
LPDAHHHVPGHDFDAGGWKRLLETLLSEFGIDLLEGFRLIMLEKNGEQKCALGLGSLSAHKNSPLLEWLARKFVDPTNITSFGSDLDIGARETCVADQFATQFSILWGKECR